MQPYMPLLSLLESSLNDIKGKNENELMNWLIMH